MKEIEVKARVTDRQALEEKLGTLGCTFSEPVHQTDTVYVKTLGPVETYLTNTHYLRIRIKGDGKSIFTFKQPASSEHQLIKTEHETEIANPTEMEAPLIYMGYKASNVVKKERTITNHNGYEICLDTVEDLGSFIEVEKLSDQDPGVVRQELFDFLMSLGISPEDEVRKGYDILMIEKTYQ